MASGLRIGPGKIALLEAIAATGSISGAGRRLGMSYKRAWDLVEEMNHGCEQPVVATSPGGRDGGGTSLTSVGDTLIRLYREIERASRDASGPHVRALGQLGPPTGT
jgi:molybdate transport system regulatory protein